MSVSTCQGESVLQRTALLYIPLPRSRVSEFGRLLSSEKTTVSSIRTVAEDA